MAAAGAHRRHLARFLAVLEAPRELIHNQAFNVGRRTRTTRVRELADMVREVVPGQPRPLRRRRRAGSALLPGGLRQDCTRHFPDSSRSGRCARHRGSSTSAYERHGLTRERVRGRPLPADQADPEAAGGADRSTRSLRRRSPRPVSAHRSREGSDEGRAVLRRAGHAHPRAGENLPEADGARSATGRSSGT